MTTANSYGAHTLRLRTLSAYRELMSRQRLLTVFATLMLAMALPAHFLGVHAQQLLPLAGWMLQRYRVSRAGLWLSAIAVSYGLGWLLLSRWARP